MHLECWGLNSCLCPVNYVHIFSEFQHVLASLQPLRTAMVVKVAAGGCIKKATFVLQSYYLREACIPCLEIRLGIDEQLSINMCLSDHLGVHSCGHVYIYIIIYRYVYLKSPIYLFIGCGANNIKLHHMSRNDIK